MSEIFTLSNGGKAGELLIYDAIGENWWGDGITARRVHALLREAGSLEELTIRINSPGGNVNDGNAIYNELHRHKAKKIVEVDALAASAASVIAMAGDEIRMAKNALFMIHEAWGFTQGDAVDHERTADLLRKMSDGAAEIYAARTGHEKSEVLKWMAKETWFTAGEALDLKFCTHVHAAKEAPKESPQASWSPKTAVQMFRRMPEQLRNQLAAPAPKMTRESNSNAQPNVTPALVPTALGKLAMERSRVCLGDV